MTAVTPVLNGHPLPGHAGGYLPFCVELTGRLRGGENVLALALDSRFLDVPPNRPAPHGPDSADFWQPGGIYRDARLRVVPPAFISDVFARPASVLDPGARHARVTYTLDAAVVPQAATSVRAELLDGARVLSAASAPVPASAPGTLTGTLTLAGLAGVTLWDVTTPQLYTVRVTLLSGGAPAHRYEVRAGFREATFTPDGFSLNGSPRKLFGLNRHQLYPFAGAAMPARVQRRDARILRRELNCNVVRCSHYPQHQAFYDACDELGLMVWDEIPGWGYLGDAAWRQAAARDLRDMIIAGRNHPSVIIWGAMPNEAPPDAAQYAALNQLAHGMDDSRPTGGDGLAADAGYAFDVLGSHDYTSRRGPGGQREATLAPPGNAAGKPQLVCEAVGALSGPARAYRRTDPQQVQQAQAIQHARVHELSFSHGRYCGLVAWAGFDYPSGNGYRVEGVKHVGVADLFRALKPGAAIYQAQADPSQRPVIAPAFWWDFRPGDPVTSLPEAMICSNLDRLELYVGGAHLASLLPDTARYGHLPHPPSFADFSAVDASALPDLRIDGYLNGALVASRSLSADTSRDRLAVSADDSELAADGSDATRVEFRAVDGYGNPRRHDSGEVRLEVSGPGVLVGESPFPFGDAGGSGAAWIRTLPAAPGTITVTATHPELGQATAAIQAVAGASE